MDPLPSPRGEPHSHSQHPSLFFPRKAVIGLCRCLESMVKHSKKLWPGYLPSAHTSVLWCWEITQWHSAGLLSLEWQYTLLQMYFKKEHLLFQSDPGNPHTTASFMNPICSPLSCLLPLSPTFVHKKDSLSSAAPWLLSPQVHGSEPHILPYSPSSCAIFFLIFRSVSSC